MILSVAFAGLKSRIGKWLAIGGAVVIALFSAWAKGRREGTANARVKAMQAEIEAAGQRANAETDANREPDPNERLRRDWSRP